MDRAFLKTPLLLVLGVFLLAQCVGAQGRLRSAENPHFEIVGEDVRSVRYIDELSQYIVSTGSRYFERESMFFPQQILVNLRPIEYVNFRGDYQVRVARGGFVTLDLRWSSELEFEACIRALTEAFFVRYALFNYGPKALELLPRWPISAISTMTYLRLRPALWGELARTIDHRRVGDLDTLLNVSWDEDSVGRGGYWLMHALGEVASSRELYELLNRSVAGFNVSPEILEILERQKADGSESADLQQWWTESITAIPEKGLRIYEPMEVSREWIQAFASFETEEGLINLRELWDRREDESLRPMIQARYDLVRLRMLRVNPAYFNAGRSLGALFETILEEGPIFEFIGNLTEFLSDFEDTKILESEIRERL